MIKKLILGTLLIIFILIIVGVIGAIWSTNNRNSDETQTICNYSMLQNCKFYKTVKIVNEKNNSIIPLDIYTGTQGSSIEYKAFYINTTTTDNRKISFVGNYDYIESQIPYRFLFIDLNGDKFYTVLSEDTRAGNNKVTVTLRRDRVDPNQDDMKYMRSVEFKDGYGYMPVENTFNTVEEVLIYYENSLDFTYKSKLATPYFINYSDLKNYIN